MTEKQIENEILNFLRFIGIFCWKNQSVGVFDPVKKVYRKTTNVHHIRGTADIFALYEGQFICIEVKSKTGKLSTPQRIFLERIRKEGGIAIVARSVDDLATQLVDFFPALVGLKDFCRAKLVVNH